MTNNDWQAASAKTFLRLVFMPQSPLRLLEPDVDAVEYKRPGIRQLHRLILLAPSESGRLQLYAFDACRGLQVDSSGGDGDQHAAGRIQLGAFSRMQHQARD